DLTAQVVDLVDVPVPLAGAEAQPPLVVVVLALDEDGVRGAGPGAQLAADALLQTVRVPVELVAPVEARLGRPLHLRVLLGGDLAEHRREGHPEPGDGSEELGDEALLVLLSHGSPPPHGWTARWSGPSPRPHGGPPRDAGPAVVGRGSHPPTGRPPRGPRPPLRRPSPGRRPGSPRSTSRRARSPRARR